MMRARRISQLLGFAAGVILLGSCSWDAALSRLVRPDDDALARAYFDSVRAGRLDYAAAALGPVASGIPGVRDSLALLARNLPSGPLDSLHIIGAYRFTSSAEDRTNLTYEYHSAQGWGFISIWLTGASTARVIEGIRGNRLKQSLERANEFTLRGKSAGHYLMLLLCLASVGSAVWVAALALRTKMKRRWAWALLAVVGVGKVMFDWTTGQVGFQLLSVLFLNAAYGRAAPAAPWILQAAFPIGAVMTWRRIQQARHPTPSPDASVSPGLSPIPGSPPAVVVATEPAISADNTSR